MVRIYFACLLNSQREVYRALLLAALYRQFNNTNRIPRFLGLYGKLGAAANRVNYVSVKRLIASR
ncbi:MAG TPA: hypothetical protein VEQ42_08665, partial [Pyrinomonadaceae bacterium]|nr:hypothetical protein [Pyrinomonadaceae bacterium]